MMAREFTFCHEVEDIYSPDLDALIEVEVTVSYDYSPAEPDVGIMCDGADDICVTATDCALFDVAQAEDWLFGGSREAERVMDNIHVAAREDDDGPDPDDWYDRKRDERMMAW